jgi:hypothetical protein
LMIRVGAFRQEPACWFAVARGVVGEHLWGDEGPGHQHEDVMKGANE